MLSKTPYLFKAFYDWIVDSNNTPYLVLDAEYKNLNVPDKFIGNGQIILNISPNSIRDFSITRKGLYFRTCFSGVIHEISAPINSIVSIYSKETDDGIVFERNDQEYFGDDTDDGKECDDGSSSIFHIIK